MCILHLTKQLLLEIQTGKWGFCFTVKLRAAIIYAKNNNRSKAAFFSDIKTGLEILDIDATLHDLCGMDNTKWS